MRKLFVIILIGISNLLPAQIENEIKSFVDSTKLIVFNGRELLNQQILNENYEKAAEVYDYIQTKTQNKRISAFLYTESVYIQILLRRWNSLSDMLEKFGKEKYSQVYQDMPPVSRSLYDGIINNYNDIVADLDQAAISEEDKDYLKLLLLLIKIDVPNELYAKKYKAFKKTYPNTKYKKAFNSYLQKPGGHYALAISMGASSMMPTGKIQSKFQQGWGAYMAVDFNIEKIYVSLFLAGGAFHAKDDFTISDGEELLFEKDDYLNHISVGVSMGYFLKRSKKWHVTPFIGFNNTTITSDKYNPDEDKPENNTTLYKTPAMSAGIHTEFKLWEYTPKYQYYGALPGYFSLKLDISYLKGLSYKHNNLTGDYFMANLGFVIGMGDF